MEDFKQGVVLVVADAMEEANRTILKKRLFHETADNKVPFELFLACNDQYLPMKKRRLYHGPQETSIIVKKKRSIRGRKKKRSIKGGNKKRSIRRGNKKNAVDKIPQSKPGLPKPDIPEVKKRRISIVFRGGNKKNAVDKISQSKPNLPEAKKRSISIVFRGGNKKNGDKIPQPKPDLPEAFYKKIAELRQGTNRIDDPVLVIQKKLYETDIAPGQGRLSIPKNQMLCEFLTNEEKKFLCGRAVDNHKNALEVRIIEPLLRVGTIKVTKWNYEKKNMSYVLNGTWNDVVRNYGLKAGMTVQVWAFRVEEELCVALVNLS